MLVVAFILALAFQVNAMGIVGFHLVQDGEAYTRTVRDALIVGLGNYLQTRHSNITLGTLMNQPTRNDQPWMIPVVADQQPAFLAVDSWANLDQNNCFAENNASSKILEVISQQVPAPTFRLSVLQSNDPSLSLKTVYFGTQDDIWIQKFKQRLNFTIPHSAGFTNDQPRISLLYVFGSEALWQSFYRINIKEMISYAMTQVNTRHLGTVTRATEIQVWFNCGNTRNGFYSHTFPFQL